MSTLKNLALIGGDRRQKYIGNYFSKNDYNVCSYANSAGFKVCCTLEEILFKCRIVILPIPVTKNGSFLNTCGDTNVPVKELYDNLNCLHIVFGGCFPKSMISFFEENNIVYHDFMADKSVSVLNSIATAEGALMEAIKESTINIHKSNCLVTGYGKCGEAIADRLKGLNANVTVAARRLEVHARIKSKGYTALSFHELPDYANNFDYIFNTVAAPVINPDIIDNLSNDCVIIDIASYPGGTDFDYARSKNIKALLKLSLPGRISPKTSGLVLSECIKNFVNERS